MISVLLEILDDVVRPGSPEYHDVQQGIASETIGPVHRYASTFTYGVQAGNRFLRPVPFGNHDLGEAVGRDPPHHIVSRGKYRDRRLRRINAQKGPAGIGLKYLLLSQDDQFYLSEIVRKQGITAFIPRGDEPQKFKVAI